MAEPTSVSMPATNSRQPSRPRGPVGGGSPASPRTSADAFRDALFCLEASSRRLNAGRASQADEILSLLKAATTHLEEAHRNPRER